MAKSTAPNDLQLPDPTAAPQPSAQKVEVTLKAEEKSTIEKTLPELIGGFITQVMEDPRTLNECGRQLQLWHDAQPLENRQTLVVNTKRKIETAKSAAEWLFSQYQLIAQKDA